MLMLEYYFFVFFFFSSRRRHTRLQGDWSSDVCSSDLLVLDAEHPLEMLTLELRHLGLDVPYAGAPGHVVHCPGLALLLFLHRGCVLRSGFIRHKVLEMEADHAAFELLEALYRVEAGAKPVAGVGAGPHQRRTAFDSLQDGVRIPVVRRLGMIVDGHLDVVLLAELLNGVQRRGLGLRY